MTKITVKGRIIFICDICGFGYNDKSTAQKCHEWCSKHASCNLQITKNAIYFPK